MKTASETAMPFGLKLSIAAYIAALNVGSIFALVHVWPGQTSTTGLPVETRFLLTSAIAGALGSYIHLASSFVEHAGHKGLNTNWAWWYFLRPLVGSALAVIVYFVVRAGFVSGAAEASASTNPYGVAAVSALSGMFSRQATEKLRELFENFCAVPDKTLKDGRERLEEAEVR